MDTTGTVDKFNDQFLEEMLLSIRKLMSDSQTNADNIVGESYTEIDSSLVQEKEFLSDQEKVVFFNATEGASRKPSATPVTHFSADELSSFTRNPLADHQREIFSPQSFSSVADSSDSVPSAIEHESALDDSIDTFDCSMENLVTEIEKSLSVQIASYEKKDKEEKKEQRVVASSQKMSDSVSPFPASKVENFEAMTLHLLRPMLQDWINNNLSDLVEKLIRQEIDSIVKADD